MEVITTKPKPKRLPSPDTTEVSLFKIPVASQRDVLEAMRHEDLKVIARAIGCPLGRSKSEIVDNIYFTKEIDTLSVVVRHANNS